jgi:hypothetical protein
MVERGDWERGDDRRMLTALRDGDWEREWEVGGWVTLEE